MSITLWQSISNRAAAIAQNAFHDVANLEDWQRQLPSRRKEYARSLGLDSMPQRCDLDVRETGSFSGAGFRAKKIGYQILPDCWGSGILFHPDPLPPGKLPAVLYVCGHGKIGVWHYQAHPIMWARRGYVCLIVDTIEQHDNPGNHHGFLVHLQDRWISLGFPASGGEVFNCTRALDLLCADPAVDPAKVGITGVSGGGAQSFFTAAFDERVKAVSTLCGLSSACDAIANCHVYGHCDCMFTMNLFQRDLAEFAALIAPRAVQFCFGDQDTLYHPAETSALAERAHKIFQLHGREDAWRLVTVDCPHGDHPEFDRATQQWFDRHLAGAERPLLERGGRDLSEQQLSIFNGVPPQPNRLADLPELLSPRGTLPLPNSPDEWPALRAAALQALPRLVVPNVESSFRTDAIWQSKKEDTASAHLGSAGGVELRMQISEPANWSGKLVLGIAGGGEFAIHAYARTRGGISGSNIAVCGFAPRLSGLNYPEQIAPPFPAGSWLMHPTVALVRALILTGETTVMMHIQDIRIAVSHLRSIDKFRAAEIVLFGRGDTAVAALYTALTDDSIAGVVLEDLPGTHADRAPIPGILRVLDIPHALGLMAPRKVATVDPGYCSLNWPNRVYQRLGCADNFHAAADLRSAFEHVLGGEPAQRN